jgi:hypothetical protein
VHLRKVQQQQQQGLQVRQQQQHQQISGVSKGLGLRVDPLQALQSSSSSSSSSSNKRGSSSSSRSGAQAPWASRLPFLLLLLLQLLVQAWHLPPAQAQQPAPS